jgi:hypothetical protein
MIETSRKSGGGGGGDGDGGVPLLNDYTIKYVKLLGGTLTFIFRATSNRTHFDLRWARHLQNYTLLQPG